MSKERGTGFLLFVRNCLGFF